MPLKLYKKFIVCILMSIVLSVAFFPVHSTATEAMPFETHSPSIILMDASTGKILYEKDIYTRRYPASLTKVMTAIIVLEKAQLNDVATVSYGAVMDISSGYVTANLQVDEELTVEQLLYLLMMASANDAAIVLAEHVSGSVEGFSALMNEKAKAIGCKDTNFVNPNGVHDENHYSTAYDLALIGKTAMKIDFFKKLVSATSYKLSATNKYDKDDRYFTNSNHLLIPNSNERPDNYYHRYATGIKTGFTTPAR